MKHAVKRSPVRFWRALWLGAACVHIIGFTSSLLAATLTIQVQDRLGNPVTGFRWLLEEDNTHQVVPGVPSSTSLSVGIHKSHAPVVDAGHTATTVALVEVAYDQGQRYYLSILPDAGHTQSGAPVATGQTSVTVTVNAFPVPTAQISILAFQDNAPLNNSPELPAEAGLEGFTVIVFDTLGQMSLDAFGNPLGTEYALKMCSVSTTVACNINADCPLIPAQTCVTSPTGPLLDPEGAPYVSVLSNGLIKTSAFGEALVKYLSPGKYGIQIIPPAGQGWVQTSTLEGKPTIDAWPKAAEPPVFVEFGPAAYHVFIGFVKEFDALASVADPGDPMRGSITGRLLYNHFSRPPAVQGFFPGPPVEDCYVGLNEFFSRAAVYSAACDATSNFTISNIPAGTYTFVTWDKHLDSIFGNYSVTIPDAGGNWNLNFGNVLAFSWFGNLEGSVFYDADQDGFRDPGEPGLPGEEVGLRFRDGSMYQVQPTDLLGNYSFPEVFPFFKWLIVENGFLRLKDTGFTNVVDYGGQIPPDAGWAMPSRGKLNPQPQAEINPNTGNNLSRTTINDGDPAAFLLQAQHLFLSQTNVIDWGKVNYITKSCSTDRTTPCVVNADCPPPQTCEVRDTSGGIVGLTRFAVTRETDDAEQAAADPWEPGIARVQVNLYKDGNYDGVIDDLDGDGFPTLADVDNYPLGWQDGDSPGPGPEDVDRNVSLRCSITTSTVCTINADCPIGETCLPDLTFYPGDAIQIVHTDSFDDNNPTGCIQTLPIIHGVPAPECFDNFGTWNQIRPGVFDGGWAIETHVPGGMALGTFEVPGIPAGAYIVENVPPKGYLIVKEEDKNVDFGEAYQPFALASALALPPPCVGADHIVPPFLSLFPDVPCAFAGQHRPLCDRKQVIHSGGQNTNCDFFMFTEVDKAGRAVGFINNDLSAEFNQTSPVFGEKQAPKWLPISFQDYAGNEVNRVYSDEFGTYNALLPSSFTKNVPIPAGVSPNVLTVILNHPGPIPDPANPGQFITDPFYDPTYGQMAYNLDYWPGKTTYLDTPVIPVAAFAGLPNLDAEPPSGEPGIYSVMGAAGYPGGGPGGGPVVCANGQSITIQSLGLTSVPNPSYVADGICVSLFCNGGSNPGAPCTSNLHCLGSPITITRDYGFGAVTGTVTVGGVALTVTSWSNLTITATVNTVAVSTGQLVVTRGDNLKSTLVGVTLHVGGCASIVHVTGGGNWPVTPIQNAIDLAAPGTTIIVEPGTYKENVINYKRVKLQGSGAGSTFINGNPVPIERTTAWHSKISALVASGDLVLLDPGGALLLLEAVEAPCVFVHGLPTTFDSTNRGLVDGFTVWGGVAGGGVYAVGHADYLEISNNKLVNNQGIYGGGINVGQPEIDSFNDFVHIHHNKVARNGGLSGGGGITIFRGADNYVIEDNWIIGNFTRFGGSGIAHLGLSDGGVIRRNQVVFNEAFYGTPIGGDGAGIFVGGPTVLGALGAPTLAPLGTGTVTIDSNLIQGNLAGSGSGGGIGAYGVNGADADAASPNPATWYALNIFNNLIVNNSAGLRGGAISLHDAAKVRILHNTIANNDSTATAVLAFPPGNLQLSEANGAGITATQHGAALAVRAAAVGLPSFSDPLLLNNIIWHNRSFYWNGTVNGNMGGILPRVLSPHWDLQVVGGGAMNPRNCVLSDATGYDPSNIVMDPLFKLGYQNQIQTAAVLDEGGNAISIRFLELTASLGNYRIGCNSPAVDEGLALTNPLLAPFSELLIDFDGETRPRVVSGLPDIGADEALASIYDVDSDGIVGPGDFSYLVPCWLKCSTDPAWTTFNCGQMNFDCTGCVDPGDFAYFVTAWLKTCGDPTILYPACYAGRAAPGSIVDLLPASREEVESFGLPYPDRTDTRFKQRIERESGLEKRKAIGEDVSRSKVSTPGRGPVRRVP